MEDRTKLPQWAQRTISKLEADLKAANEMALRVSTAKTLVTIGYSAQTPQHIPDNEPIVFALGDSMRSEVAIHIRSDREGKRYLDVNNHGNYLTISPRAANSIELRTD